MYNQDLLPGQALAFHLQASATCPYWDLFNRHNKYISLPSNYTADCNIIRYPRDTLNAFSPLQEQIKVNLKGTLGTKLVPKKKFIFKLN